MDLLSDLALARWSVDRAPQVRNDPLWLEQIWADPQTRVLLVDAGSVPVTDELSVIWIEPDAVDLSYQVLQDALVFLGQNEQHRYVALFGRKEYLGEAAWASLKDVGAQLTPHDVGLATTGIALESWHRTHTFCPACGTLTHMSQAGWARECPSDGTTHFPRTEPAVIAVVEDAQGRILLGRRLGWADSWYSVLAGFVEAGESCETAVVREIQEESGVLLDVASLRFLGSQPWPFPASLMMGYSAKAVTTEIAPDETELSDVRWFSRVEFEHSCNQGTLRLPNATSIAWRLIEHWYGKPLPLHWSRA